MDISQELIIDVALNAAGYLTAALLSIVLYSIFIRRNTSPGGIATQPAAEVPVPTTSEGSPRSTNSSEFIKLGSESSQSGSHFRPKSTTSPSTTSRAGRRDRSSIVEIATKMLKAGAGVDKIKDVLPISEAELSLLKQSQKI